jgi:hypothetical protein
MTAMAKEWASFPVPHAMQGHVQQVKAGDSYYKKPRRQPRPHQPGGIQSGTDAGPQPFPAERISK